MSKYEVTYPAQPPIAAAKDVFDIVRGGPDVIFARRAELGLAWYQVQGYAQGLVFGNPDDLNVIGVTHDAPIASLTQSEFLDAMELLSLQPVAAGTDVVEAASKIDWKAILKFFLTNILPLIIGQ